MDVIVAPNDMMEETSTINAVTVSSETEAHTKNREMSFKTESDMVTKDKLMGSESETETVIKELETIVSETETFINEPQKVGSETETYLKEPQKFGSEKETYNNEPQKNGLERETYNNEPQQVGSETETFIKEQETTDSETDTETDSSETETTWSNPDTSSSNSRKKNQISNCEILAQMKNRHEDIVLNSRLRSLHFKQCREEESLTRTKKQLIETMKKSKRTSGSSPDPYVSDRSVTPLIYKYYQAPWAYSFSDRTHNSLYKEIEQLPKRSFRKKGQQSTTRPTVKSAPARQRTVPSLLERSISTSNVELNGNSNETLPLLQSRRKPIMRPHTCAAPTRDTVDKGIVHFNEDTVRPHTCKHGSRMSRQVERKQSWIKPINRSNSNPITDTRQEKDDNKMPDDEFVSKYLGNPDKVNRYRYINRKKEDSSQVVYRGQKLKNYIRPQDRYKKDPLNLMKREKMVLKLSMTDSESLEESRKAALKAGEAFPKAARLRMLNELIASNNDNSRGPYLDYDAELQARIDRFLRSIDEFRETRSTSSYSTKTGSVNS